MGCPHRRVRATPGRGCHTMRRLARDADVRHDGPGRPGADQPGRKPAYRSSTAYGDDRPRRHLWPAARPCGPLRIADRHDHLRTARRHSDRPPPLCYFAVLRSASYLIGRLLPLSDLRAVALSFSAASSDFEASPSRSGCSGSPRSRRSPGWWVARRGVRPRRARLRRTVGPSAPVPPEESRRLVSKSEQLHARLPAHRFDDQ